MLVFIAVNKRLFGVVMNSNTFRVLFSLFLIAHGLVTMSMAFVPVPKPGAQHTPFFPSWWRDNVDESWPINRLNLPLNVVRTSGWILWMGATIGFVLAGVGLLGLPGFTQFWQLFALAAAIISLILLVLFWHPWDILGLLLNFGILAAGVFGWFTRWFS
jgi:hypothetical protein